MKGIYVIIALLITAGFLAIEKGWIFLGVYLTIWANNLAISDQEKRKQRRMI